MKKTSFFVMTGLVCLFLAGGMSVAAADGTTAGSPTAARRIVQEVDESKMVSIQGSRHPLARAEFDEGVVSDGVPLEHMLLQLQRGPAEELALQQFIGQVQDPHSAEYHNWLTAEEFGARFGPAQKDIETVTAWLESHGMQVNLVYASGMVIDFSGNAGNVREAFGSEIHKYNVKGIEHIANAEEVQIPAALASVVLGVKSLNDFRPKAMVHKAKPAFNFNYCFTTTECLEFYDLAPADFATVYNINPLRHGEKTVTGKGQSVTVIEDTDIQPKDWYTFRNVFGLSSYSGTFSQIHPAPATGANNCTDPGRNGDEVEAALDAEWSGAVAPDAAIVLASCADTATSFGGDIAAQNLLNSKNPPPILSVSYGSCEAHLGPAGNGFYNAAWQQAASEGVSVYVAAGDWAAAVCDLGEPYAATGINVNGFASTPYNVAVGGTDFLDYVEGTTNTYWSATNGPTGKSVRSYVPEMTWNDSCAGQVFFEFAGYTSGAAFCNSTLGSNYLDVVAGSGGPSFVYGKPKWQSGVYGTVNDGKRDLPDVSLFASNGFWNHGYLLCMSDASQGGVPCDYSNPTNAIESTYGGTSFGSPEFAGIQALINQKTGSRQGNPNPTLYALAGGEYGGNRNPSWGSLSACNSAKGNQVSNSCVFYDTTVGDNDVPCYGTNDCYTPSGDSYGVLSTSDHRLKVAYPAGTGWDFATGLGTVNIANLVSAWYAYAQDQ